MKVILSYFKLLALNLKEHKDNIPQVAKLAVADLKKTYTGAALGWAWAVIKPIVTIFVYWFAIEIGLRKGGNVGGVPYILWLIAGMVPWFYISETLTGGADCIRRYSYLVTKMRYPVMTIPTFTNLSKLFVNIILTLVAIIVFWLSGYKPTVYLLQLPIYIFLMFMLSNAWALFAGLISAISKDFSNLVKSFVTAVFWLSGVIWNVDNVSDKPMLRRFLMLNPVTFICNGFRNCFVNEIWFYDQWKRLSYYLIFYAILVFLSLWAYKKLRKEIPDVL